MDGNLRFLRLGLKVGLVICFLAPNHLSAQEILGTLVGTVKDATGGVVVGAMARLTNDGTRVVLTTVTDSIGGYQFLKIAPGKYTLEVSHAGFRKFLQS